jgi:hypothetical protein
MSGEETRDALEKPAKVISVIFHPVLMPVYGLVIVFSAPTLFGYLPSDVKKLLLLILLLNNVLMPLSLLPFFRYRNVISSWTIENRSERSIPLSVATLLYLITSFIIYRFPIPGFLKSYIIGVFFLSLTVTIINFFWKISLHSVGSGALTALVFILSYRMYSPLEWYMFVVIIISGMVLTSRLRLNLHNPSQVWFGFLTGFVVLNLSIMLI